jgi:uncharacterized protein with FMN-binding domain
MNKSQLSWVAVALVLAGVAILTGHPAWGAVTGGALVLLAGAAAAGAARMRSEGQGEGARGQRVPNNLVTLSAAAIIAVYAAGFNRTRAAADAFAAQAARRRAPAPIAASVEPSKAAQPAAQTPPAVATATPSPVSPVPVAASKKDRASDSALRVRSKGSAPAKTPQPDLTASLSTPPAMAPGAPPADPNSATPAAPPAAAAPTAPTAPTGPAESLAAPPAAPATAAPKVHYRDGTYYGWGRSAHGDIRASVVIQGGKIVLTGIDKCQTAYSCSWIAALPGQVVTRQNPTIDCVSGASDSSYAFQDAVTAALFRAQGG